MIEYLRESYGALFANRLRTLLALLGLAVGVAAVISIQILGNATSGALAGIFKGFSNYTFVVQPNFQTGFDEKSGISPKAVSAFDAVPHAVQVIPFTQRALDAHIGHAHLQEAVAPVGDGPNFYGNPFAAGRPIDAGEVASAAPVCVLSANAAKKTGVEPADLVGQELRAGGLRCTIVGVLQEPAQGALSFDLAAGVSIPSTLFERTYLRGSSKVFAVEILVDDPVNITVAEDAATKIFSNFSNGKYTYQAFDSQFIANQLGKIFLILTVIVGAIGAISLVVAGIGIMNILLVSIVERTREIGVRKAIGGTRGQIMLQFAIEAAALTFGGCLIGSALGIAIGWWVNVTYLIKISGVIVPVQWQWSVALAVVFATLVTAVFGLYPAYRAARLNPIEALRYE